MDYEASLISTAILEDKVGDIVDSSVLEEYFVAHKEVWDFVKGTYSEHGKSPPKEMVAQYFPDFKIVNTGVPITLAIGELKKRYVHNSLRDSLRSMARLMEQGEPLKAFDVMKEAVVKVDVGDVTSKDVNLTENPLTRMDQYHEVAKAEGMVGIPTPWKLLNEATLGFQPEDLIMLAGRGGVGKCIDSRSRIQDPVTGVVKTIEEVVLGPQLGVVSWSPEGGIEPQVISQKVDTGYAACLGFELETGRREIVTPEHPFKTPDGWKRADLLSVGDYVAIPTRIPLPIQPKRMKDHELRMLAILLSEGTYSGNHIGFSTAEERFHRIAKKSAEQFGAVTKHISGVDYDFVNPGKSAGRHTPNPIRQFLRRLGVDGKKAVQKTIPDEVFCLDGDQLSEFLGIFWMADGYLDRGVPGITLGSKVMVHQIQHLLLRLGIQSSVHYKSVKGGKYHSWRLRIYSHCCMAFSETVGRFMWGYKREIKETSENPNIGGPKRRNPLPELKDLMWVKVQNIEGVGKRKIYDLTVEPTSCFVANDILVHNTWGEVVMAVTEWQQGYLPLVISNEMSVRQMVRRIDATNAKLPYQRFRAGMLGGEELERWERALRDMDGGLPFWVSGDRRHLTVTGIRAKIRKYRPNIVWIDGGYLLDDELGGKAMWERWSNVCKGLKQLAQDEGIPIGLSHQFNLEGKKEGGTADTLKYGDVQMWFDLIVGMYQSEDLRASLEMLFKILKMREGEGSAEWVSGWDLNNMEFPDKGQSTDDLGAFEQSAIMDATIDY